MSPIRIGGAPTALVGVCRTTLSRTDHSISECLQSPYRRYTYAPFGRAARRRRGRGSAPRVLCLSCRHFGHAPATALGSSPRPHDNEWTKSAAVRVAESPGRDIHTEPVHSDVRPRGSWRIGRLISRATPLRPGLPRPRRSSRARQSLRETASGDRAQRDLTDLVDTGTEGERSSCVGANGSFGEGADGDAERDESPCSLVKASGRGDRLSHGVFCCRDGRVVAPEPGVDLGKVFCHRSRITRLRRDRAGSSAFGGAPRSELVHRNPIDRARRRVLAILRILGLWRRYDSRVSSPGQRP